MAEWRIDYDNDTGPGDEGFSEQWTVTNDDKAFRTSSKDEAEWLLAVLRAHGVTAAPASSTADPRAPACLPESMSRDAMLKYYSEYANMVAHEVIGYQRQIRELKAALAAPGVGVPPVGPAPSAQGPTELWLQLHGDCSEADLSEPVDYTGGDVTWCWHKINDSDVRYVRADIAGVGGTDGR